MSQLSQSKNHINIEMQLINEYNMIKRVFHNRKQKLEVKSK
ncbi:hypothetical protein SDC9_79001 [bioreactor metagenome]|uniref:Uncharacterized protein n=1 Tax=bioreactor metagenome TaxID=1076179 RepID=A0A644YVT5_9ZZZZ